MPALEKLHIQGNKGLVLNEAFGDPFSLQNLTIFFVIALIEGWRKYNAPRNPRVTHPLTHKGNPPEK